ncbi:hypothetical protein AALP_AA1G254100 [Arabis alpina]|uniref:DUF7795 domain-containing protein n=1 Tax=Arabis alpina TaxID=50452 RepID=A0A087HQL4_ARAAL|nr:hypothetical protein AALP_AA1G254100 [Arabis alpina]
MQHDENLQDKEMEARSQLKQKRSEIFKQFMTGITKLEELGNAANNFLLRFHQGFSMYYLAIPLLYVNFMSDFCFFISSILQRPPNSSKLIDNIIKQNETRRLQSYVDAGCINIHDVAQCTRALHTSLSGLNDHLVKAQSLLLELERLTDEAALAIETDTELDKESSDEENTTLPFPKVTEYATLITVVYSMVKQNYAMQEKIVKSLSLKSSSGELETYILMWSLRPFVEDEIMKRAWKCVF